MSIPLLFNNTARSARADRFRRWLAQNRNIFHLIEPESRADMLCWATTLAQAGTPVVAVAGGDGTLRLAAEALKNTGTALCLFPAGTVNVFSRELGIRQDFAHALHILQQGRIRNVDLFSFNDRPFLQMAGLGADARTVELTTWEMKKKWGALSYVISGFRVLTEKQPYLTLTTDDGRSFEGRTILFGNGKKYGGPIPLFAEADNADGLLDAIVFERALPSIICECLLATVHGGFKQSRYGYFTYVQMTGGNVTARGKAACELDGDYEADAPIRIARSGTLKVFVP